MDARSDKPATKKDLDLVKQDLTAKIDVNGRKIDQVEQRLTAKIDANSAKIDANGRKINANSASIDRLTIQVMKNNEAISKTLTREEYKKDYNELLRGQDEMMVVLLRIDQERVATNASIDRVERDVERLKAG